MFGSENFIFSSPLVFFAFLAVSLIFCFLEYKTRVKWPFAVLGAVSIGAAFLAFLYFGASLADLLLYLLMIVFVRLIIIVLERRTEK